MVFLFSCFLTKGHLVWYCKSDHSSLICEYLEELKGQKHSASGLLETALSFSVRLYVISFDRIPHFFFFKSVLACGNPRIHHILNLLFDAICLTQLKRIKSPITSSEFI